MNESICATCPFFALVGVDAGECRANPPMPIPLVSPGGVQVKVLGRWPETPSTAWCAKHPKRAGQS